MEIIAEESAKIYVPEEKKMSKDLPVFYNPIMKLNRDLTILFFQAYQPKNWLVGDILAGTGVRTIRLLKEVPKSSIKKIFCNDIKPDYLEKNMQENNITERLEIAHHEANRYLLSLPGMDYIDIDPFGSPNPFLHNAMFKIKNKGVLAVTATDTAALTGTYPKACKRKYWATPLRNECMHEIGMRILIRKVQLIAAQFEKALIPILTYTDQHYYRVFFLCQHGKSKVDIQLKQHAWYDFEKREYTKQQPQKFAGPLYTGDLQDQNVVKKMIKKAPTESIKQFMQLLAEEDSVSVAGFIDMHQLTKKEKIARNPKFETIIEQIKKNKHKVSRVHTNKYGLKTTMPYTDLTQLIKELS